MKLSDLFTQLDQESKNFDAAESKIKAQIQTELNKRFDDWQALQKAIAASESATMYGYDDRHGGVYTWFRFGELSNVEDREREYLAEYLSDLGITIDWENDCLQRFQGDCITIQDCSRHKSDDGVWYDGKRIIPESDYITGPTECDHCGHKEDQGTDRVQCPNCDDGVMYETEEPEVNEALRNELIEQWMDKNGYFPAVLHCDYHGNLTLINTLKKES